MVESFLRRTCIEQILELIKNWPIIEVGDTKFPDYI